MRALLLALFWTAINAIAANDLGDEAYKKIALNQEPPAVAATLGMESTVLIPQKGWVEMTWWQDTGEGRWIVTVVFHEGRAVSKNRTFTPFENVEAEPPEKH